MDGYSGPRIGVALGGGSARGLTHIPFIEAMDELGLTPSIVAGTSIGALIGSGWASGMPGRAIREHALEVLGSMRAISGRLWRTQLRNWRALFRDGVSMQLDAMNIVEAFVPPGFPPEFGDLKIPFFIVATDFQTWHQVVFHTGPLKQAIAGSIAIPSLFRPVSFGNHLLVDGGVVNPLPLDIVAPGSDLLIGIDVNGAPQDRKYAKGGPSALDVGLGSAQIMMHALTAHTIAAFPPDVYFRPPVHTFGAYEFWRVREIIEAGDKEKDRFKRAVAAKVDAFIAGRQKKF